MIALVAALVILSVASVTGAGFVAARALATVERAAAEHRRERETLLRMVVAKNTGELANLERIETERVRAGNGDPRRQSPQEFQRSIDAELREMGLDPTTVPRTPEGL